MDDLTNKKCKPCEGSVKPLTEKEISHLLNQLNDWQLINNKEIKKTFEFKNFFRTMSFTNAVAHIANQENHHPEMKISFNKCAVHFKTHAIGALSENDFICAAKVDKLI